MPILLSEGWPDPHPSDPRQSKAPKPVEQRPTVEDRSIGGLVPGRQRDPDADGRRLELEYQIYQRAFVGHQRRPTQLTGVRYDTAQQRGW